MSSLVALVFDACAKALSKARENAHRGSFRRISPDTQSFHTASAPCGHPTLSVRFWGRVTASEVGFADEATLQKHDPKGGFSKIITKTLDQEASRLEH